MGIGSFSTVAIPLQVVRRGAMLYISIRTPKGLADSFGPSKLFSVKEYEKNAAPPTFWRDGI